MSRYRRDIDGLRAVAIAPVVLFHAGFRQFSGGFVGVDVFFVISGYLITQILVEEYARGAYSVARFYERRIRRIFPALFFMLAVLSVACLAMLPGDLRIFGRTLLATIAFGSNLLLWRSSGYFDLPSENNVLTHTWSLAVEEQYYIFFPVALWLVFRVKARRFLPGIIGLLILVSLALSEWLVRDHASTAFYLLPPRAWELMVGSWLAVSGEWRLPRAARELISLSGLAMISTAVVLYDPQMRFPGASALLPCMGAAAIILAGRQGETLVGRGLAHPALVGLGLISYSLYLWHWPLLVLPRLYLDRPLTHAEIIASIIASTAMAVVSWRYVERPFRRPGVVGRRELFRGAGAVVAAGSACALLLGTGMDFRAPPHVLRIASFYGAQPPKSPGCNLAAVASLGDMRQKCLAADASVVLWGDSHAGQYASAVSQLAAENGLKVRVVSTPGCAPLPHLAPVEPSGRADVRCAALNTAFLGALAQDPATHTVVLAGRWARFFFPEGDPERRGLEPVDDVIRGTDATSALTSSLGLTIDRLAAAGKRVILIGQAPEATVELPRCLAVREWRGLDPGLCALRAETFPDRPPAKIIAGLALAKGVAYVRPGDVLCRGGGCVEYLHGVPVLADTDHLTRPVAFAVLREGGFGAALMR